MTRGRGRGRFKGQKRQAGDGHYPPNSDGYIDAAEKSNADFNEYYQAQQVVPPEEWDDFMTSLTTPLPVTFRINGSGRFADHLRDKLQSDYFSQLASMDTSEVKPPRPLPWYPHNYAWHLEASRNQLRRMPLLEQFHDFLKKANTAGSISRQEAVSMVPPLFLDVHPHHKVLDMCAAPGSKTAQLLEMLHTPDLDGHRASCQDCLGSSTAVHSDGVGANGGSSGVHSALTPAGFVVANDADLKRCNLLTHQTQRICSPCLLVTNHDAQRFPALKSADGKQVLKFDRILCDVPCSGDGTMRKSPDIWRKWSPANGNGLHIVQLRIALRGVKLLKVGGRLVYSTCTFNPVEDEAVVSQILSHTAGAMELLDVSSELPTLKRTAGKNTWKVRDRQRYFDTFEDAQKARARVESTSFPSAAAATQPLHRCMRFLPHHQDTGGFFVAVLQKVAEWEGTDADFGLGGADVRAALAASADVSGLNALQLAQQAAAEGIKAAEETLDALDAADPDSADAASKVACAAGIEADAALTLQRLQASAHKAAEATAAKKARRSAASAAASAAADAVPASNTAPEAMDADPQATASPAPPTSKPQLPVAGVAAPAVATDNLHKSIDAEDNVIAADGDDVMEAVGDDALMAAASDDAAADVSIDLSMDASARSNGDVGPSTCGAAVGGFYPPSWVRGGGSRNRGGPEGGGKYCFIDPIAPVQDPAIIALLADYYGLDPDFPVGRQLICRTMDVARPKRIYFLSASLQDLLIMDHRESLKVTATGLKVFERQDMKELGNECPYRLAQEGIAFVLPHVTKQRIQFSATDMLRFLTHRILAIPGAGAVSAAPTAAVVGAIAGASSAPAAANGAAVSSSAAEEAATEPPQAQPVVHTVPEAATDTAPPATAGPVPLVDTVSLTNTVPAAAPAEEAAAAPAKGKQRQSFTNAALLAQIAAQKAGCVIAELCEEHARTLGFATHAEMSGALAVNAPLAVTAWKGRGTLAIMVEKGECGQLIDKLDFAMRKAGMDTNV